LSTSPTFSVIKGRQKFITWKSFRLFLHLTYQLFNREISPHLLPMSSQIQTLCEKWAQVSMQICIYAHIQTCCMTHVRSEQQMCSTIALNILFILTFMIPLCGISNLCGVCPVLGILWHET
jgi:hypothetical protein